ncbi:Dicarboxylate transporter 1, chloroplastic [Capsicum baccatum]|uniref:Dicarboxylate transporter 1, chloroplastic n=1 Tax=Capsicum baccatum TaxID=33114 RepID=A0A2G2V0V8_CAPBA|nr:Dicarboxylate transporter 1, chloroplastic [Capsicum baccatum]
MDSGATRHVCTNKELFSSFALAQVEEMLYMANSATAKVKGTRKICLKMTSDKALTLNSVLYVLELRRNLISVSLLDKNGFKCVTVSGKIIVSKGEMYVGKGYLTEVLYKMNVMTVEMNKSLNSSYLLESYDLWHERLGHVNYKTLRKLINLEVLPNFECNKSKYQTCVESKYAKHPYKSVKRNSNFLDLIHTDICDMKSTPSRGGKKYFITFIDDCTRYCYVYLLNSKDEAIDTFRQYKTEVENQLDKKIKMIRSNRGGEYESPFAQICVENGITDQTMAPYSSQSNGIAERKNRTLKEMMNVLLISSGLPQNLWGEAILTANRILNIVPHTFGDTIPWLITLAFIFAKGFIKTRLGNKIACQFVKLFGSSSLELGYSLVFSEALLAPAILSVSARAGAIFLSLIMSLCVAHSSHDKFINKKIDIFDEISLVRENDRARSDFAKSFGDIDIDCSSKKENDDDIEVPSMKRDVQDIVSGTSQIKATRKRNRSLDIQDVIDNI